MNLVKRAEHILGFEEIFRNKILEIEGENDNLRSLLFEIIIVYRDENYSELHEKLREAFLYLGKKI